jgi:NNP family nitrate/nitrite transporter-like MFS transporter
MSTTSPDIRPVKASWLSDWRPEDAGFWETPAGASRRTLTITTLNLILAFIIWFVVSALVVRPRDRLRSHHVAALAGGDAGLAGGSLRIIHTFLIPLYGTRKVVTISTLSLLIPAVGWFYAVQDPTTPFWVLMLLAFLAGLGGGNFSSFMPSTSLFFPKRLQGTALAIRPASVLRGQRRPVQTPWIIGFSLADSLLAVRRR